MEVPWQMPVLPSYSCGVEDDADDIPPSPTPDPVTPTLTSGMFFQRGFWDCAQEALRFLTEEEGLAEDGQVVTGLKNHLVHSTQQFTPASLTAPSQPVFTFSPPARRGVMQSKLHQDNAVILGSSYSCASSSHSDGVRFAPYTLASHRGPSVRLPRAQVDKHSLTPVTAPRNCLMQSAHRLPATMCSSTRSFERVLQEDFISADDLQGVLRCLQSVPTPPGHLHTSTLHSSTHLATPISHQPVPTLHPLVTASHGTGCVATHNNSLNDSGVSETSSADLTDEVDGVDLSVGVSEDVFDSASSVVNNVSEDVFDSVSSVVNSAVDDVFDSASIVVAGDCVRSVTDGLDCEVVENGGSDKTNSNKNNTRSSSCLSPTFTQISAVVSHMSTVVSPTSTVVSPISTVVSPITMQQTTTAGSPLDSCPSSQLSLLSSLSSGSHRLTAPSVDGSTTASRIQSLASEILLLLQEEAEAGDDDDDDDDVIDDNDRDLDEDASFDEDSDGEDVAVEVEP